MCPCPLGVSCGSGSRSAKAHGFHGHGQEAGIGNSQVCKANKHVAGVLAYEDGGGSSSVSLLSATAEVEEQVKLLGQKVLDVYGSTGVLQAGEAENWKTLLPGAQRE